VRYWKTLCIELPLLLTHPSKNPITTGEQLGAFSPVPPVDQARFAQAVDLFGLGITYQFWHVDICEGSGKSGPDNVLLAQEPGQDLRMEPQHVGDLLLPDLQHPCICWRKWGSKPLETRREKHQQLEATCRTIQRSHYPPHYLPSILHTCTPVLKDILPPPKVTCASLPELEDYPLNC